MTGNYLSRWYTHTINDVKTFQVAQETQIFDGMKIAEAEAMSLYQRRGDNTTQSQPNVAAVKQLLQDFQESTAKRVHDSWWDFFFQMAGKYRDMYRIDNVKGENFVGSYTLLSVPRQWMELIGYWGQPGSPPPGQSKPVPVRPISIPSEDSLDDYKKKYPLGLSFTYSWPYNSDKVNGNSDVISAANHSSVGRALDFVIGIVTGGVVALVIMNLLQRRRHNYLPINDRR